MKTRILILLTLLVLLAGCALEETAPVPPVQVNETPCEVPTLDLTIYPQIIKNLENQTELLSCVEKMQELWESTSLEQCALGYVGVVFQREIEKKVALNIVESFNLTNQFLKFPDSYDYDVKVINATNKEFLYWILEKDEVLYTSDPEMTSHWYSTVVFPIDLPKEEAKELIYSSPFEVEIVGSWQTAISGKVGVRRGSEGYWYCRLQNVTGIESTYLPNDIHFRADDITKG